MKPPCKTGCGRLAWAARGYCHQCYDRARRELKRWREQMELRRWLLGRGLTAAADALGRTPASAQAAGGKPRGAGVLG